MVSFYKKRLDKFTLKLKEGDIYSSVFVCSDSVYDSNVHYFTGFKPNRYESFSILILTKNKRILFVSPLEYASAKKYSEAEEIIKLEKNIVKEFVRKAIKTKNIGINTNFFPIAYKKIFGFKKLIDISNQISDLRAIKDKKEIEHIKKACRISNVLVDVIENNLSEKITEKEIADLIEYETKSRGGESAFSTIVTSGKRSALIHPIPSYTGKKLGSGLGIIDFGVRVEGYSSDVTVPLSVGKLSSREKEIRNGTIEIYDRVKELLRPKLHFWEIYDCAKKIAEEKNFEIKHSLGHGIGLGVHEFPSLSPKPKGKLEKFRVGLKENMFLAFEPGLYLEGIGGCRIENDFLITKSGAKRLTNSRFIEK